MGSNKRLRVVLCALLALFVMTGPSFGQGGSINKPGGGTPVVLPGNSGKTLMESPAGSFADADATSLGSSVYCADAGSNDTYACSLAPAITVYTAGTPYSFKANTANTGAATINFNALGAKTIVKVAGGITTALADNDIRVGQVVDLVYDGTNMQMQSLLGNVPGANPAGSTVADAQCWASATTLGVCTSPAFASPTATTQSANDNSTKVATTAYVDTARGAYLPLAGGTMLGNLLFTDATYNIGASGATRPRDLFLSRNAVIGGTSQFSGAMSFSPTNTYNIGGPSGQATPHKIYVGNEIQLGPDGTDANAQGVIVSQNGYTLLKAEAASATSWWPGIQIFSDAGTGAQGVVLIATGGGFHSKASNANSGFTLANVSSSNYYAVIDTFLTPSLNVTSCSGATLAAASTNWTGSITGLPSGTCTIILTFNTVSVPRAQTGWVCAVQNMTTGNLFRQSASTTTTATFTGTSVSGDVLVYGPCGGY